MRLNAYYNVGFVVFYLKKVLCDFVERVMDEIRKISKPLKTRNEDMEVKKQIFCIICLEMLIIMLVLMYFTSQKTLYMIF